MDFFLVVSIRFRLCWVFIMKTETMAITAGAHTRCVLLRRHTLQFLLAVLLFIFFFSIFFSVASYIFFLWLFLFIAVIIISFVLLPLHSFKRFNVNLLNQNVFTISLFYFISIESQHLCAFCWCCWCCCCHSSSSSSFFFCFVLFSLGACKRTSYIHFAWHFIRCNNFVAACFINALRVNFNTITFELL